MTAALALVPSVDTALAQMNLVQANSIANLAAVKSGDAAKARTAAEDFEAVFLNSMFNQMFTAIEGEGPFGGSGGAGVWRSFLADEYAKSFAKAGGIGIASQVYQVLLAQQEATPTAQPQIRSAP